MYSDLGDLACTLETVAMFTIQTDPSGGRGSPSSAEPSSFGEAMRPRSSFIVAGWDSAIAFEAYARATPTFPLRESIHASRPMKATQDRSAGRPSSSLSAFRISRIAICFVRKGGKPQSFVSTTVSPPPPDPGRAPVRQDAERSCVGEVLVQQQARGGILSVPFT